MSTDNLANLKEEASMLSMDQIIRYIHIFSELSGQIRYAAQKRILVEIALIKLCKPEMETDQEAVLDRIRQVEEKVENGIVVTAAQMPAGAPGAQGVPQAGVAKPKPQLPKAVPEDIQEIVLAEMAGHRGKCRESHEDVSEKRPIKSGWRQQAHGGVGGRTGFRLFQGGSPRTEQAAVGNAVVRFFQQRD